MKPQGLLGELACEVLTDYPERFKRTKAVLIGDPPRQYRVERARVDRGRVFLKLAGIDDRDAAEALRGALIEVEAEQAVELPEGAYFWHQIIGLRVEDGSGRELGHVAEILPTGSNDVYVVRGNGRELLLPAIRDVVRSIDLERQLITVELLPGLEA